MSGHHHHGFFDPYSRIDSPLHHLPAGAKLGGAIALVLCIVTVPVKTITLVTFFPALIVILIAASGISFVPPSFLFKRIAMMEPVVLGVAVMALFQPGGVRVFLTLAMRSTLCLAVMLLLSNTTPFSDTLAVLRKLRMPRLLVTTLGLMYRYLYVLTEEGQRMRRARASRTFTGRRGVAWTMLGTTIGHLFVRTADRAERIYLAMCARGFR
jgi:cobalt/nickel transport system permease protein